MENSAANAGAPPPAGTRAKRSTRFKGNFALAFDQPDDDDSTGVDGGDDAEEQPKKRSRTRGRAGASSAAMSKKTRTKECPGCGNLVGNSVKVCQSCDYQFTARSLLIATQTALEESQSIREKFPFEPDREEDGSLLIDVILGRRPHQQTCKRRGWATGNRAPSSELNAIDAKFEYEYLVKYKHLSYLHVQWLSAVEIDAMNAKAKTALLRYLSRIDKGDDAQEDGEIDPSFIEIEKVLDMHEEEVDELVDEFPLQSAKDSRDKFVSDGDNDDNIEGVSATSGTKKGDHDIPSPTASPAPNSPHNGICAFGRVKESRIDVKENDDSQVTNRDPPESSALSIDDNETLATANTRAAMLEAAAVPSEGRTLRRPKSDAFAAHENTLIPTDAGDKGTRADEPTSVQRTFNHIERCREVLKRLWDDPYALSFRDPVDTTLFEGYLDVVETPMCLRDVEERLCSGEYDKYMGYRKFAADVRLIWINCKAYNLYKSQIWHCAHVLSIMFERLFRAWVTAFADGSVKFVDPVGQPWVPSCRVCQTDGDAEQMMLCDHCDASYHIYCLQPSLPEVPEGIWMCKRCTTARDSGAKLLSATVEEEARNITDTAGLRKVIKMKKKKYLVKWRGLSYRDCTWETAEDINDDAVIAEYHKLNDSLPEELPLTSAEIDIELAKERRNLQLPAMHMPHAAKDLDATVYAQIRVSHFLNWNILPPAALLKECGAETYAYAEGVRRDLPMPPQTACALRSAQIQHEDKGNGNSGCRDLRELAGSSAKSHWLDPKAFIEKTLDSVQPTHVIQDPIRAEVSVHLAGMIYEVARSLTSDPYPVRPKLPPPTQDPSEIEVYVKKGGQGSLCMKVGNFKGRVAVLGFRPDPRGGPGPAELTGRIQPGDIIFGIDGHSVLQMEFADVLKLLALDRNYIYLRLFRASANAYSDALRVRQAEGDSAFDYVEDYIATRKNCVAGRRPFPKRSCYIGVYPSTSQTSVLWEAVEHADMRPVSIGVFDEEIAAAKAYDEYMKAKYHSKCDLMALNFTSDDMLTPKAQLLYRRVVSERAVSAERIAALSGPDLTTDVHSTQRRSDSSELTDDLGWHSDDSCDSDSAIEDDDDEADDDDANRDVRSACSSDADGKQSDGDGEWNPQRDSSRDSEWKPGCKSPRPAEQLGDGPTSRLLRAVGESGSAPIYSEWSSYIMELGLRAPEQRKLRKVHQVDLASDMIIQTWASVAAAARILQIPAQQIQGALAGNGRDGDVAGGFKWRWSSAQESLHADSNHVDGGEGAEDDGNRDDSAAKKDKTWMNKLHKQSKEYRSGGRLRDYQLDGLNWLLRCWYSKRSSILADEMGLGKTVQVVAFLDHLFEVEKISGPFLVVVPLSTIGHWRREVEGWSRMVTCLYHDAGGGRDMRDVIREFEWYFKGRSRRVLKFHVLITTYDDLVRDYEELAEVPWRAVIVDEAHRLRNVNSKLLECMRSVCAKGLSAYGYQHRVLMTGTPLQNKTAELWSLLNFIEPAKFPDLDKFDQRFGNINTQEQVESLQRRIAPHLLRRVKEDVAKDIPPKEETIIDVELTTMQKQYYRAIFERNHGFLMQTLTGGSMPTLNNIQMELRKCCNHPFLIQGVEDTAMENIERDVLRDMTTRDVKHKHIDQSSFDRKRMEEIMVPTSGKMVLLDKLLPKLRSEGHKVLIFSQMVKMIDLIEEFCQYRDYPCERLDGRIGGNDRQKAIDRFNHHPDSFIFLLSTRAGGVGITLTAADTCIIFDSDWNPQNDVQAMARCHRIGQKKNVTIYRLITRRSFEAEMFERASKKLGLEQAVLGTAHFNDKDFDENQKNNSKVDAKEMEQLLREGAYAVLLEDNDETVKEFCEQDIDSILKQRSHVLVTEGAKVTEPWLNKKQKSKTRKSAFTGELAMEHADIDVNDPDFWKKVLPDLVTPDMMLERLSEESLASEDDKERGNVVRFMKDLSQMMDGMLDLHRRDQLPDRERAVCMKLLLQVTLKTEIFDAPGISKAQKWLSTMEGTRKRRARAAPDAEASSEDPQNEVKTKTKRKEAEKGGRKSGRSEINPDAKEIHGDHLDEGHQSILRQGKDKKSRSSRPRGHATGSSARAEPDPDRCGAGEGKRPGARRSRALPARHERVDECEGKTSNASSRKRKKQCESEQGDRAPEHVADPEGSSSSDADNGHRPLRAPRASTAARRGGKNRSRVDEIAPVAHTSTCSPDPPTLALDPKAAEAARQRALFLAALPSSSSCAAQGASGAGDDDDASDYFGIEEEPEDDPYSYTG